MTCAGLLLMSLLGAAGLVVHAVGSAHGGCNAETRARRDLWALSDAADVFRIDHGRWPRSMSELDGRYLREPAPLDPWGTPYELRLRGGGGVLFVSLGPYGAPGGGDDLTSASPYE